MAITSMPAIDAEACSGWTENDIDMYNTTPFYLAKMQAERRRTWTRWAKLTKKRRWQANKGPILRGVTPEPSPHLRQFFYPNLLRNMPKKDVINVTERIAEAMVHRHRFESPALNFYPDFNDFLTHVDDTGKDIMEKIERAEDLFIRTNVWHMAPFMFVAEGNTVRLVNTNPWSGTGQFVEGTDGKIPAMILANLPTSHLTLAALNHALSIMETDLRVPFFRGSGLPKEDAPLDGMYALLTSSEAYNQFTFDPWLLQAKNCDLDIVNDSFRGKIFGRITSMLEDLPLRFRNDGTFPAPEIRDDSGGYNDGGSPPSPLYSFPDETGSPNEVSWLVGSGGYESIEVGPPPAAFTGDKPPHNFPAMFWNGEVKVTKQKLTFCVDADTGLTIPETNVYGEYLWFISQVAYGILATQRRNIIPILHKRKRGV